MIQRSDEYPGKVAVMAQFMPKFTKQQSGGKIKMTTDEDEIEEDAIKDKYDEKLAFIFIVDSSGSMGGQRMEMTKKALELFIQSLPTGCKFKLI